MPSRSEPAVITPRLLRGWPLPVPDGDKASRGTVLVVGGSRFTPGAVLLAGVAALRSGAGVLQLAVAESTAAALSIEVPEALVIGLPDSALVLDAYALGALSHDRDLLAGYDRPVVLTPNLTEAKYLLGREPDADLGRAAAALAGRYGAVVSLFGHIAAPDGRLWREESGDAGLGTSGSGDVRAGIVAGLLSRGADPAQAACWGAYAHAGSGQRLAARFGRIGFLARELLDEVPHTIAEL